MLVPASMKEMPSDTHCVMLTDEVVADLQTSCPVFHGHKHNLKNRFELKKTLGKGTYGKVKLATEGATGKQVAIKYIKKSKIQDEHDLNRIRREIKIMASLHHPHIINVHEVYENRDRIILVMECADGGELYDYINNNKLTEKEARRIFRQIVSAIKFCHQNGIVHRDLKLENILLDHNNNAKIADFGLSNYYSQSDLLKTYCGSPLYASPEIVNGQPYYGPEVDCWSLGVVLYTLVYGTMPFDGTNFKRLRSQITTGDYYEPANPSEAAGLIRHLLTVNPAKRATILDIICHWWVNLGFRYQPDNEPYVPPTVLQPVPTCHNHNQALSSSSSESDESEVDGRSKPKTVKPLKGILKKPKMVDSSGVKVNTNTQCNETKANHSGEGGCGSGNGSEVTNENSNPLESQTGAANVFSKTAAPGRSQSCDNIPEIETQSSRKSEVVEGADNDVVFNNAEELSKDAGNDNKTVFDSHKMPKRGILKRKGKFSSCDSGCEMSDVIISTPHQSLPSKVMDLSEGDSALDSPDRLVTDRLVTTNTKDPITCAQTQTGAFIFDSGSTNIPSTTSSTLPSADTVVVVPRRKGILKNSSRDPDKRLSTCSTGSNSSADILDFSYDSSDESLSTGFLQRDSTSMSVDSYGSEIRDLRLQGQAALGTELFNRQEAEDVLKQALEISKNL